jgi:peptidoglycan/LPS O-acetylase OafA/YrhL
LVMRFRRARGAERQQLRWVAMAAGLLAAAVVATVVGALTGHPAVSEWTSGLFVALLPVAIGAAILRYRLYDLDRIISRTLAYGLLTVLLGGGYAAVVLGLGRLLPQGSSLVVAAATLAVAAVFQPLRRRVQQAVDRRFNRRRHDAAETIQAFSTHLRDQLDLDTLGAELLAVVDQTMQPTQASLWLRPSHALSSAAGGRAARQ